MKSNDAEKIVREKYEKLGYDAIKNGFPDFIFLKNGTIQFVEVKQGNDSLSDNQKRAHKILREHGFDVKVEYVTESQISRNPKNHIKKTHHDKNWNPIYEKAVKFQEEVDLEKGIGFRITTYKYFPRIS